MDAHKNVYIDNLAAAVEIKSVSAWPECRPEIVKMVKWMGSELEKCGATIEYCDVGMQDLPDGGKYFLSARKRQLALLVIVFFPLLVIKSLIF